MMSIDSTNKCAKKLMHFVCNIMLLSMLYIIYRQIIIGNLKQK